MFSYGWLSEAMPTGMWIIAVLGYAFIGFHGLRLYVWTAFTAAMFWSMGVPAVLWYVVGAPLLVFNVPVLRRFLISNNIMVILDKLKLMPEISETEKTALEAGSTWVDAELFSGRPNLGKVLKEPFDRVSEDEQRFIDNQVEEVCNMVTDWEIYQTRDLPPRVWDYLKKERFLGMIIPKEYGGLGFSAIGHSEVIQKLASRSTTLTVSVMVPNSLGPAELLIHYGTQEQKDHYLPRLARGEEIPCFALTEPNAGSDASSIQSDGEVFRGDDGKLYVKLNWDKRYITLAAISTVLGLAIKLRDPQNLLGKGEDPGITCILVPADAKGVVLGKRHNPMGVPFYNCPTKGHDVVVPVDQIIGGADGAGRGWTMLMESLAAGRSISLPSQSAGGSKATAALASSYSVIRRQFGVSIGKFEGIEEPLARITGYSYALEAMRIFTAGAVDNGIKPAVVSAIAKYMGTELARKNINDGMDILGGAGISRGPRNLIANGYMGMPISITVEGANILTRSMIIFGQGAIRCHPFAYKELEALTARDRAGFDHAFWGHIGHVIRNTFRAVLLSLTRGHLARTPGGPMSAYYRKLAWQSATFAIMSDIAMGTLGGALKMKEKLTGRYSDILCWMYLATCTLRRFEAEGRRTDQADTVRWVLQRCMIEIQRAFDGIFRNFEVPILGAIFRGPIALWSSLNSFGREPSDQLGHKISAQVQLPGSMRESICGGIFIPQDPEEQGRRLEITYDLCYQADGIYAKIRKAVKAKKLPKKRPTALVREALDAGVISKDEADLLERTNQARDESILVDAFDLEDFSPNLLDLDPEKAPKYGKTGSG